METIVSSTAFARARAYILAGEVVAFHTETVYGLGANAYSDEAVGKVFALKGRPSDNPLIVHIHRDFDLLRLIDFDPPYADKLRRAFLPGPLTMVYPSKGKVSALVSCGLNTLAVRVPASKTAQAFLREVNLPIAAPSANLSKHVSPVTAQHVLDDFGGKIPLILDGGKSDGGIESTVLDITGDVPMILREGLVTREMIASIVGECGVYAPKKGEKPKSPGIAHAHYMPRCKTAYFSDEAAARACYEEEILMGGKPYLLCEHEAAEHFNGLCVLDLGRTGEEMASRLYALLREGEKQATRLIGIEPKKKGGAMAGVLNRLHRAFGAEDGTNQTESS